MPLGASEGPDAGCPPLQALNFWARQQLSEGDLAAQLVQDLHAWHAASHIVYEFTVPMAVQLPRDGRWRCDERPSVRAQELYEDVDEDVDEDYEEQDYVDESDDDDDDDDDDDEDDEIVILTRRVGYVENTVNEIKNMVTNFLYSMNSSINVTSSLDV